MTADSDDHRMQQVFFYLACFAIAGFIAYVGRGVIIPFIVAIFLSFLIFTLKNTVKSTPLIGRFLPGWLAYLFAFALIASAFVVFVEIIRDNIDALIKAAPQYEERLAALTRSGIAAIENLGILPGELVGGVNELRSNALGMINPILREVGSSVRSLTANSVTIFLYTVFILLERGRIFKKLGLIAVDEGQRAAVNDTIGDIGALVKQYISVKTITNLVTATISFIIMHFVGVDFAGFWALLIFVLNFIPIVGAITAIALPVILLLVQPEGGGFQKALLALGFLVGAEQTMSSAIEPRLIGKSLNLSPLVILLSLAVWGALWGFAGMLLAVPITVTVMLVLSQFAPTRPIAIMLSDNGEIAEIKHLPVGAS